ncbi:MAG: hypothetical protein EBS39_12985 [Gammaproteobacteria bacterium]|nr:hypothetical protein [Gammaproteobacteria bacterium]
MNRIERMRRIHTIHFVGIGGSGMGGIAEVLLNLGYAVQGSDLKPNAVTARLQEQGARVHFGHDCVMDPWYSLGTGDMLEVAQMGVHVAQMTGLDAMGACFDAVTCNAARLLEHFREHAARPAPEEPASAAPAP